MFTAMLPVGVEALGDITVTSEESYERNRLDHPELNPIVAIQIPDLVPTPWPIRETRLESLPQALSSVAVAAFNPGEAETETRTRPLNPAVPSPLPITVISMLPLDVKLRSIIELTTLS
jgi:hypothetical protein